jgi:hypothetical protein
MRCDVCYAVASHTKALVGCAIFVCPAPQLRHVNTRPTQRDLGACAHRAAEGDDCAWAGVLHHAGGSKSEFSTTFTRCFFPITSSRCASSRALSHSSTSCTRHNPCLPYRFLSKTTSTPFPTMSEKCHRSGQTVYAADNPVRIAGVSKSFPSLVATLSFTAVHLLSPWSAPPLWPAPSLSPTSFLAPSCHRLPLTCSAPLLFTLLLCIRSMLLMFACSSVVVAAAVCARDFCSVHVSFPSG